MFPKGSERGDKALTRERSHSNEAGSAAGGESVHLCRKEEGIHRVIWKLEESRGLNVMLHLQKQSKEIQ